MSTPPTIATTTQAVQLKIAVDDEDAAVTFYRDALDLPYRVVRRTDDVDYSAFMIGEYGELGFFLLFLLATDEMDRPGRSTFGLTVVDLDAAHARALTMGGKEAVAPRDAEGMPRSSAVLDPSGNWVWLYQG